MIDLNKMKINQHQLVRTKFQKSWQFRVEIEGYNNLDIYVKDITYSPIDIETRELSSGMATYSYPSGLSPVEINMTVRDDDKETMYLSFVNWANQTHNNDGTGNPPLNPVTGFVRKLTRFQLLHKSQFDGDFSNTNGFPSLNTGQFINIPYIGEMGLSDFSSVGALSKAVQKQSISRIKDEIRKRIPSSLSNLIIRGLGVDGVTLSKNNEGFIEIGSRQWNVFCKRVGEVTESKEEQGFNSFPVSLVQFRT